MTLLTKIREQIVPITIEAVILSIGYFAFMKMPPQGTAGDIIAWFILLVAFCVVFSLLPGIAIIYGWYSGNRIGALFLGILPLPALYILVFIVTWFQDVVPGDLSRKLCMSLLSNVYWQGIAVQRRITLQYPLFSPGCGLLSGWPGSIESSRMHAKMRDFTKGSTLHSYHLPGCVIIVGSSKKTISLLETFQHM
jgi:hypothetical protein